MMRSRGSTSILNELYRTTEVAHASAVGVGMSVRLGSARLGAMLIANLPCLGSKFLVFEGVFSPSLLRVKIFSSPIVELGEFAASYSTNPT